MELSPRNPVLSPWGPVKESSMRLAIKLLAGAALCALLATLDAAPASAAEHQIGSVGGPAAQHLLPAARGRDPVDAGHGGDRAAQGFTGQG